MQYTQTTHTCLGVLSAHHVISSHSLAALVSQMFFDVCPVAWRFLFRLLLDTQSVPSPLHFRRHPKHVRLHQGEESCIHVTLRTPSTFFGDRRHTPCGVRSPSTLQEARGETQPPERGARSAERSTAEVILCLEAAAGGSYG